MPPPPPPAFKCILFNRWTREANVRSFELSPSTRSLLPSPSPPLSPSSYWEYSLITRPSLHHASPPLFPRVAARREIRTSRRDSPHKGRIPFFRLGEPEKRRRANFLPFDQRTLPLPLPIPLLCVFLFSPFPVHPPPPRPVFPEKRAKRMEGYETGVTSSPPPPPPLFPKRVLCARESGWHLSKIKGMGILFRFANDYRYRRGMITSESNAWFFLEIFLLEIFHSRKYIKLSFFQENEDNAFSRE